jgi:hypothetical protein
VSKDLAIKYWTTHFQTMIDEKAAATDTIPSAWRAGGRATKAYPEKENDIWWQDNGPKWLIILFNGGKIINGQCGTTTVFYKLNQNTMLCLVTYL